jgi:hypothetical protein
MIQGEYAPSGPIVQVTAVKFTAGGRTLVWRRDPLDAFRFHVSVPEGVQSIDVDFDYLSPPAAFNGSYGGTPSMTPHLAIVLFNHVLLLPESADASTLAVRARVRIPDAWSYDAPSARRRSRTVAAPRCPRQLVDAVLRRRIPRTIALMTKICPDAPEYFCRCIRPAIKDGDVSRMRRVVHKPKPRATTSSVAAGRILAQLDNNGGATRVDRHPHEGGDVFTAGVPRALGVDLRARTHWQTARTAGRKDSCAASRSRWSTICSGSTRV